jgi:hypothetical protein
MSHEGNPAANLDLVNLDLFEFCRQSQHQTATRFNRTGKHDGEDSHEGGQNPRPRRA